MGLLTPSNGGITPQRYGRVVAQTEEQLLAFTPEIDFVWGFVYGSSKRWLWFGGVWKIAQVVGKGTIGTALPPASVAVGSLWVDGAMVYQDKFIFRNAGSDSADVGRPTALVNLLIPTGDYEVEVLTDVVNNGTTSQFLVGLGFTTRQFTIYISSSGAIGSHVGNSAIQTTASVVTVAGWKKIKVKKTGSNVMFYLNGVLIDTKTAVGAATTAETLQIMPITNNAECDMCCVTFSDGSSTKIDAVDFSDASRWDGGLSGATWAGNPFIITAGAPSPERIQAWVPINL